MQTYRQTGTAAGRQTPIHAYIHTHTYIHTNTHTGREMQVACILANTPTYKYAYRGRQSYRHTGRHI